MAQSMQWCIVVMLPSNHKEDGTLIERWNKAYDIDEVMRVLVPQLRCVSANSYENSCFVGRETWII